MGFDLLLVGQFELFEVVLFLDEEVAVQVIHYIRWGAVVVESRLFGVHSPLDLNLVHFVPRAPFLAHRIGIDYRFYVCQVETRIGWLCPLRRKRMSSLIQLSIGTGIVDEGSSEEGMHGRG